MVKMPLTLRRPAAAGTILAAVLVLTGCTQSPAGHDERLSKAAGLARVTIVCPKDLWEETKPSAGANEVKAKISEISTGPRSGRGLVEVSMTGTNLVAYLKELDYNAHPSSWNGNRENTAASDRVYDAIAPAIDRIKAATSPDDPEPEIVIDDTIPDEN
uniref:Lipoprotein n=1 Tax=Streptomyces sp. NBC_00180 TaxID=2903632 RepID=A0AAU1IAA0_9ACTN